MKYELIALQLPGEHSELNKDDWWVGLQEVSSGKRNRWLEPGSIIKMNSIPESLG